MTLQTLLEQQLEREMQRHNNPTRAAEGIFALCLDQKIKRNDALTTLEQIQIFPEALEQIKRFFLENETFEILTRERVLARRSSPRASALFCAQNNDLEGLRRLTGQDLQLALKAASILEAKLLIEAWNFLSVYEQTRG